MFMVGGCVPKSSNILSRIRVWIRSLELSSLDVFLAIRRQQPALGTDGFISETWVNILDIDDYSGMDQTLVTTLKDWRRLIILAVR